MLACNFVLSIWMVYIGLVVKCHAISNILPTIMDEFRIYQPILLGDASKMKEMIEAVKKLNYHRYSIGFGQKQLNQYQSYIIFTADLTQFKWNNPTYAPILVVSKIQIEEDLKKVNVSIGSEVLFLDWVSLKIYESYTINEIQITRFLGHFQATSNRYKEVVKFVPSFDYNSNMENRRCDFYGLQLTGAVSWMLEDPGNYSNDIQFFPNNDTFDITKLANDPKYYGKFWSMIDLKILNLMENKFNFTSKLFLRKDMKIGSPYISSNGSTMIGKGVFYNLVEGSIDFIWDDWHMSPIRKQFVDFLPTIRCDNDAIFVPIQDTYNEMDWNVFFQPLGTGIWMAILIKCIIFSIFSSIIEWFHDFKLVSTVSVTVSLSS